MKKRRRDDGGCQQHYAGHQHDAEPRAEETFTFVCLLTHENVKFVGCLWGFSVELLDIMDPMDVMSGESKGQGNEGWKDGRMERRVAMGWGIQCTEQLRACLQKKEKIKVAKQLLKPKREKKTRQPLFVVCLSLLVRVQVIAVNAPEMSGVTRGGSVCEWTI